MRERICVGGKRSGLPMKKESVGALVSVARLVAVARIPRRPRLLACPVVTSHLLLDPRISEIGGEREAAVDELLEAAQHDQRRPWPAKVLPMPMPCPAVALPGRRRTHPSRPSRRRAQPPICPATATRRRRGPATVVPSRPPPPCLAWRRPPLGRLSQPAADLLPPPCPRGSPGGDRRWQGVQGAGGSGPRPS